MHRLPWSATNLVAMADWLSIGRPAQLVKTIGQRQLVKSRVVKSRDLAGCCDGARPAIGSVGGNWYDWLRDYGPDCRARAGTRPADRRSFAQGRARPGREAAHRAAARQGSGGEQVVSQVRPGHPAGGWPALAR